MSWTHFRDLLQAAEQFSIPDTKEAMHDLQEELRRHGVKPNAIFKRTFIYPKFTIDDDDKWDIIFRYTKTTSTFGSTM
jgi:hypothetical protein